MQKILVITGLPGSGKSTYVQNHKEEFGNVLICDDYYKSAPGRTVHFTGSAYYEDLRKALIDGRNVVIADIVFCEDELREEMQKGIAKLVEELHINADIEYRYFENDPEACMKNILSRGRPDRVKGELQFIEDHKNSYRIPEGAVILPVYRST